MLDAEIGSYAKSPVTLMGDARAIMLTDASFRTGFLRVTSYARPGKLFTASHDLMTAQVGRLKDESLSKIIDAVVDILRASIKS